ncbi:Kinetochore protein Spc24 [Polyrhizophydium stewartii]|uniref:Kinetochore protein Spc24 n=1 Tax=Polyrhizophydium stewartii TaxID=2732419 RepID=A0ABR4N6V1_9FUNG
MSLFEDDDDDVLGGEPALTINEQYAEKYDKRKRREEVTQLTEKHGKVKFDVGGNGGDDGDDDDGDGGGSETDSEDEPEDEFGELVTPQVDAQIMKTIAMIRSRRPEVYDPSVSFFSEEGMKEAKEEWARKRKQAKESEKPMFLKDFHRKRLLENAGKEGADDEDDDDEGSGANGTAGAGATHAEEQEELKRAFKSAAFGDGEGAGEGEDSELFTVRPRSMEEIEAENREYSQFLLENMSLDNPDQKSWEDMKKSSVLDESEVFLMDYILNRGWIEKSAQRLPTYDEVVDDSEDEEAVEAAEEFENKYNFRFEEEGSAQIVGHARDIEGLARRKDDRRKRKREQQKQRKAEEKLKKAEELKRLKNLKMEELRERLTKIRDMAGGDVVGFDVVDLEKDFDPNDYDSKMQQAFSDSYYNAEDATIKPEFDDDIDISDITGGKGTDRPKLKKQPPPPPVEGDDADGDFVMDADYMPGGEYYGGEHDGTADADAGTAAGSEPGRPLSKKERKKLQKEQRAAAGKGKGEMNLDEYLNEYYQLDYEDMIGDLPTRFKYRQVEPQTFGLKPEEILEAEDADLNALISLKKLAPYRRTEVVERDLAKWNKGKKKRLYEFRSKLKARAHGGGGRRRRRGGGGGDGDGAEAEAEVDAAARERTRRAGIDAGRLGTYSGKAPRKRPRTQ